MFKKIVSIFKTKKVIVVSDSGIRTSEINNFHRFYKITIFLWCLFTNVFFLLNSKIQYSKDRKIVELKNINANLNNNINNIVSVVSSVENYLESLNFYDRFSNIDIKKITDVNNKLKNNRYITAEEYKKIVPVIDNISESINNIEILVDSRINGINDLLKNVSLEKKARDLYNVNYKNLKETSIENSFFKNSMIVKTNDFLNLKDNINYLKFLELFLNSIPISKPMKNYYISSKFGSRIDPFTKQVKTHNGLDFAGPYNSIVYAPADGVVNFIGSNGGFGNSVSVNHGNGITTVYAHLGKILVKNGDKLKRGDKIGIQGSTGRSTGQHLHWEVRVDKKRVDPMKFVKVGDKIF